MITISISIHVRVDIENYIENDKYRGIDIDVGNVNDIDNDSYIDTCIGPDIDFDTYLISIVRSKTINIGALIAISITMTVAATGVSRVEKKASICALVFYLGCLVGKPKSMSPS